MIMLRLAVILLMTVMVQGCATYKPLSYAEQKMTLSEAEQYCDFVADDASRKHIASQRPYQPTGRPTVDAAGQSGAQLGAGIAALGVSLRVKERCMYQQGYGKE